MNIPPILMALRRPNTQPTSSPARRSRRLAAFLALCLLPATVLFGQSLSSPRFPDRAGIQLKNEDMSSAALTKAQATGVGYARKGIYWDTIETSPGVFNWTQTDTWINDMEARGFSMVVTIVWNNRDYEDIWDRAIVTPAGRQAYANFVSTLVTRYQGKDIIWEIWNEPNLRSFWHENAENRSNTDAMAEEYTELVKVAVPAMKAANPACRVVAGSISALWTDSFNWFDRCIEVGLLTSGIDGISLHPYGFRWPELAMLEGYTVIRQKMNAAGATTMPIINSEVGYPEDWLLERGVPTAEVETVQAWQFVRQNLVDAIAGLPVTIWYELTDASYGVLETNLTERPTFLAAQVMTAELAGYEFKNTIAMSSALDYAAVFENAAGDQKLVVWTSPDKNAPLLERVEVPHAVTLPLQVPGSYAITDTFGNTSTIASGDGNLSLTITGGPQYIPLLEPVSNETNVALGKTATVSSGSGANKLTDGLFTDASRWMSSGTGTYPQWAEVDLAGTFLINRVVFSQHSQRTTAYQVEVWNGTAWSVVASASNSAQEITVNFAPVAASKVRFTVTAGVYYLKVWELAVYGEPYVPAPYENVALGKTATISSGSGETKLTDGLFTDASRWLSSGTGVYPQWAEIDLGGSFAVDRVIFSQHSQRTNSYLVEVWSGSAWTAVASGPNSAQEITVTFPEVTTTRVRFTVTAGVYYLKVWELAVWGRATGGGGSGGGGGGGPVEFNHEAETLSYTASDVVTEFTDSLASAGKADKLDANAAADQVTYTVPVTETGTYTVKVRYKILASRGIAQLAVDGVNVGAPLDQYGTGGTWNEATLGNVTIATTGNKAFKFTITGKHASSTGYNITIDAIKLVK